jgi:replicative DNA helicase
MASAQIMQRLISTISGTSLKDSQRGDLSIDGLKRVYQANKVISASKLYIDDTSMITPPQILSKCRRLKKREGRIDLLVIDYLQLMIGDDGSPWR